MSRQATTTTRAGVRSARLATRARGYEVVGVDLDPGMLATARAKAPHLPWIEADLTKLDRERALPGAALGGGFDVAVMAGNVMIFVAPGTEGAVLRALCTQLVPKGLVVAGFQLRPGALALADYDRLARDAGFEPVALGDLGT